MSRRGRRAKRVLSERREDFERMRDKQGHKRPGSLNPRKSYGGKSTKRG